MHPCVGVDVSKHHLHWTLGEDGPVEHLPNTGRHSPAARNAFAGTSRRWSPSSPLGATNGRS